MAISELFFLGGPTTLLELSVQALFKVISSLIPPNTKQVERCIECDYGKNSGCDSINGIRSSCKCYRYYSHVCDILSILPFELQENILEVAQKDLDNSSSSQILLAIWMAFTDCLISAYRNKCSDGNNFVNYGPKRLSTPIYLYNDHESRHLILQQLIRVGEAFDLTLTNKKHSNSISDQNSNHFATSFLSFNMYKFNYEIGKKEYVINGKSERRISRIKDHYVENKNENFDCNENITNEDVYRKESKLCSCSICNYTMEKLLVNKVLILYSSHLHTLILPSVADVNLLYTLSSLAHNLKVLDLSFSMCVDDASIKDTIGSVKNENACKELLSIYLEGTNVTEEAVLSVLSSQRNLEHIESEFLTSALLKLNNENNLIANLSIQGNGIDNYERIDGMDTNITRNAVTSLKRLCLKTHKSRDVHSNVDQNNPSAQYLMLLQNLGEQSPKIQYLTIPRLCANQLNALYETLPSLPCLAHLYLGEVKLVFLEPILSALNNRLLSFQLSDFSDIVDLRTISDHCSNLTLLAVNAAAVVISGDTYINKNVLSGQYNSQESEVEIVYKNIQQKPLFPFLKEFRFNVHAIIPRYVWTHLFLECHDLEGIDMTSPESMTDEHLLSILTSHDKGNNAGEGVRTAFPLCNLTSFFIRGRHCCGDVQLTEESINNLSRYCKRLKYIGDCCTWSLSKANAHPL